MRSLLYLLLLLLSCKIQDGKDSGILLATTKTNKKKNPPTLVHKTVMKNEFSRMAKVVANQPLWQHWSCIPQGRAVRCWGTSYYRTSVFVRRNLFVGDNSNLCTTCFSELWNDAEYTRIDKPIFYQCPHCVSFLFLAINLPQTTKISFPNGKDELINFEIIIRPDEVYYRSGKFEFTFQVSPTYPHEAPKVQYKTKVYHPNVELEGNVYLNILHEDWKPVLNINTVIYGLKYLFT
ncbi:hypothetical protein C5167_044235, partial [Papaver somniferum]